MQRFFYWLAFGILAFLLLIAPHLVVAQSTIPITGNVGDASNGIPPGMGVKFELYGCGSNIPRVVGVFGIIKQNFTLTPDSNGLITGTIWPNDVINCGGVTGTTRYNVTVLLDNIPQTLTACYAVLSTAVTFNLNTATPCTSATPPTPPGGPYDGTFLNLNVMGLLSGGNALFSGTVQAHQFLLDFTPTPCSSGSYMTGYTANFGILCGTPAAASILSFNGRGGNVVSVSGDYNCSMVTGAICSLPTLYYQTVQNGGSSLTPRGKLNMLSGANATVSCVDNAGANSTDCTIAAASSSDSATTCNGNGCYYTKPDGTKVEWGTSGAAGTGADTASVSITFPLAFSTTSNLVPVAFADNCSDTCSGKNPLETDMVGGSLTTAGFSVQFTGVTPVGGGGNVINSTVHALWHAIGK
jgi:hypothetical protein